MIRKIYLAALVVGSVLLSSCDSYLDIQPVGQVIPNTLSEYRELFTTAYSTKSIDRGVTEFRSDIATPTDATSTPQNSYSDIEKWNDINPSSTTREFDWSFYYTNIYYANAIIDKKDKITEGSQSGIDQLVGEAYLMRGYMHFILVNLYGQPYTKEGSHESKSIPLKWNIDLEEVPSRNTVKEIYTAVLSDIQSARERMNQKEWEKKYSYRFSTLSVDAFESRVYLYMGEWQKAYEAAERSLSEKSTLEDLNNPNAKIPTDYESVEVITAYDNVYSTDLSDQSLLRGAFMQKYEAGIDLRIGKFYDEANDKGNYPTKKCRGSQFKCTFRTAEMYLNAAEAAAHLNKITEARTRLLQLMEKRYTPEGYEKKKTAVNAMSQADLIIEVLEERARELAFEGHRWFDLRRTTRPRIEKVLNGQNHILTEDDSRYTLRIPQTAIEANPGLLN